MPAPLPRSAAVPGSPALLPFPSLQLRAASPLAPQTGRRVAAPRFSQGPSPSQPQVLAEAPEAAAVSASFAGAQALASGPPGAPVLLELGLPRELGRLVV